MNLSFHNFKKNNFVFFAALVFIILSLSFAIPALRSPLLSVLKFPLVVIAQAGREANGIIFYHRNYVLNEKLAKEVDFLKRKLNDAEEASLENGRLKNLLALKQASPYKVVAAKVIGRDPSNWSSTVIINKGSSNGIEKGSVCITYLGLVGRVVEAGNAVSKVILINDPNLGVSAIVQRSRQEGLVAGSLGGYLVMKYLPKDCDIKPADEVITSGLTENYPKGLLIGTVTEVGEDFAGLSRYAVIKPSVNLSCLEEVLVIVQ
ncbi:MAG: rod shape-determining protein MreC [Candidatus Omnitrophica bacterium]|nr:rod shape-determining protein MreC [Candidatus Omnitrophota bacterium]